MCARACLIARLRRIERIEEVFGCLANDKYEKRVVPKTFAKGIYIKLRAHTHCLSSELSIMMYVHR